MAKCCGNWKRCSKKVSECTQIKGEKTKTSKKRTPWRRPSFGFYPPLLFFWAVENSTEIVENIQKEIAMVFIVRSKMGFKNFRAHNKHHCDFLLNVFHNFCGIFNCPKKQKRRIKTKTWPSPWRPFFTCLRFFPFYLSTFTDLFGATFPISTTFCHLNSTQNECHTN